MGMGSGWLDGVDRLRVQVGSSAMTQIRRFFHVLLRHASTIKGWHICPGCGDNFYEDGEYGKR